MNDNNLQKPQVDMLLIVGIALIIAGSLVDLLFIFLARESVGIVMPGAVFSLLGYLVSVIAILRALFHLRTSNNAKKTLVYGVFALAMAIIYGVALSYIIR